MMRKDLDTKTIFKSVLEMVVGWHTEEAEKEGIYLTVLNEEYPICRKDKVGGCDFVICVGFAIDNPQHKEGMEKLPVGLMVICVKETEKGIDETVNVYGLNTVRELPQDQMEKVLEKIKRIADLIEKDRLDVINNVEKGYIYEDLFWYLLKNTGGFSVKLN